MADEAVKQAPKVGRKPFKAKSEHVGFLSTLIADVLTFVGDITVLTAQSVGAILRGGVHPRELVAQMGAIGADSLGIVLTVTTATGAVFAFYSANLAMSLGFTGFIGGTIGYAFLNELGPVLGGVALAARSGAAIAAEIGSMVVTEQVDALRAMAVSPIRYLVAPRVLAAFLMLPLLTIIADFSGMCGGMFFVGLKGIPKAEFIDSIYKFVEPVDLIRGLIKSFVFGYLIGIVSCRQGLNTKGGATGVGRSTTSSVVLCVILIFVADLFLTQLLNGQVTRR